MPPLIWCRRALIPAVLGPLVVALGGCGPAPLARQDGRRVMADGAGQTLPLGPGRTQWRLPVRVESGGGERLSLVVELECDRSKPASGLVSLTRLRHQDDLLGLDRADPSLERSWGGESLPPPWLRTLARQTCEPRALPPRWRDTSDPPQSSAGSPPCCVVWPVPWGVSWPSGPF